MKNIIVICPTCKMRVIPKSDGTCPSCQHNISHIKQTKSNEHTEGISTTTGIGFERFKNFLTSAAITLIIFVLPAAFMAFCWSETKFPIQIFGNNEDHFRGHVIDPIPESVKILDVEFDDIIVLPDVEYYFHFVVNRNDLKKIISYNSLEFVETSDETSDSCSNLLSPPKWWIISSSDGVEAYKFGSDGLFITLCYDVPNKTAYYLFSYSG